MDRRGHHRGNRPPWRGGNRGRGGGNRGHGDRGHGMRGHARDQDEAHRRPDPERVPYPISVNVLEQKTGEYEPQDLMVWLVSNRGVEALINQKEPSAAARLALLKAVRKALEAGRSENLNHLLIKLRESAFFSSLSVFLCSAPTESMTERRRLETITEILVELMEKYMIFLPSDSHTLVTLINLVLETKLIPTLGLQRLLPNVSRIKEMTEEAQKQTSSSSKKTKKSGQEDQPPDDFREIDICPTAADLANTRPFLRKNQVTGCYKDLHTYLDVQFRLLREDLVKPLRDGIQEFKNKETDGRFRSQNVKIYNDVKILSPDCTPQGITYQVCFGLNGLERVRWENSKRLIFGSLLCFSSDEFESVMFGTVANRDPDHLKQGRIDVFFREDNLDLNARKTFSMVESSSYFEAYRHVLKALQETNEEDLPFQRYFIGTRQTNMYDSDSEEDDVINIIQEPPRYLDLASKYDITPLMKKEYKRHGRDIAIRVPRKWPAEEMMSLDLSQLAAIKSALTKELSIIQGPPGTGKTYIGLKVAEILLLNSFVWNSRGGPILVLCYTNHALDQFLEGILGFHNEGIVRVGSRSKNPSLDNYSLSSLRATMHKERRVPENLHRNIRDIKDIQRNIEENIEEASVKIEATRTKILSERELGLPNQVTESLEEGYFVMNQPAGGFQSGRRSKKPKCFIVEWLGCGNNIKMHDPEQVNNMMANLNVDNNDEDQPDENIEVAEEAMFEYDRRVDEEDQELMDHLKMARERRNRIRGRMDIGLDLGEENVDKEREHNQPDEEWQISREEKKRRKNFARRQLRGTTTMNEQEREYSERRLWQLSVENRWKLYRTWIIDFCGRLQDQMGRRREDFNRQARRLQEMKEQEFLHIMKKAKVIGMTTTGAAKNHSLVQELKPSIVIVEEAAEVLEAHIISGLTSSCQHLILIGDHQQLRPSPTVFELSKHYNLDVSLFERLIKNNLQYDRLDIQHRMHPNISKLLVPHIYEELQDHDSVNEYPTIKGVSKNMFFVNHQKSEDYVQDGNSKQNNHEANYIVELCRYLLKQGYKREQITILTTYSGQLFAFKKKMKKEEFKGLRVSTVDNYQGEENDIILLSLVRSNEEGSIGFLGIDNRVCVALSRARHALFCIGNFEQLCQKSKLWTSIMKYVHQVNSVGPALKLACQLHPEYSQEVSDPSDFKKMFPEGGCTKPCNFRLDCGHTCQLTCHPGSPEHEDYKCRKKCHKIREACPLNHKCAKLCYEDCGDCPDQVEKTISGCDHKQMMRCGDDPTMASCRTECPRTRKCGHKCKRLCGDACNQQACLVMVTINLNCGHQKLVACSSKDAEHDCSVKCEQVLDCNHKCPGTCTGCKQGRLHKGCKEKCDRPIVCGHVCRQTCGQSCFCSLPCQTTCSHNRCGKSCGSACVPCKEPCTRGCIHSKCSKLCFEPCDMKPCMEPCHQILPCGHPCIGLCGEKCPGKCRVCHREEVTEILFGEEDEPDAMFVELEDCQHIIHVESMDYFVETSINDEAVKLAECPKCKTPVRRTPRYNTSINIFLQNVEKVKAKLRGEEDGQIDKVKKRVLNQLAASMENDEDFKETLKTAVNHAVTVHQILAIEEQAKMVEILKGCTENMQSLKTSLLINPAKDISQNLNSGKVFLVLLKEAAYMKKYLMNNLRRNVCMSQQQIQEANNEVTRVQYIQQFFSTIRDREKNKLPFSKEAIQIIENIQQILIQETKPFCDERADQVKELYRELKKRITGLGVSDIEKRAILSAMGESKGHWYKCPNGHVYLIGDCGGATVESKCNECGAAIGGGQHRLRQDNDLATEMDGATQSAWPGPLHG